MMDALWITSTGISSSAARRKRSLCVVAQKTSPTTRKETWWSFACSNRVSAWDSTHSLFLSVWFDFVDSLVYVFMCESYDLKCLYIYQ